MNPSDSSSLNPTPPTEGAPPTPDAVGPEDPSPLEPYFLRSSHVMAAALLAAVFFLLSNILPLWHTDVWVHLKLGQWIVQQRQLPTQEPFSPFTDRQSFVPFQWLSQVSMYLVFAAGDSLAGGEELRRLAGGVEMLDFLFALLVLLRCLFLLLAYRRISGSMPLACVGVLLAESFVGHKQRPQFFGEMLFAALLLALSRPVLSRRALVLVPLGFVLWANLHGSYAAGLALLGLFFLGRIIDVGRAAKSWRLKTIFGDAQAGRLFVTGVISIAAIALLNPQGPGLLLYTLRFSQNPNIATMVEWQSLDFDWEWGPQWGYGILCLVVIATQIFSPRLLSPTCLLLCASFGVFPLFQRRMIDWWALVVPWIVLPEWVELGRRLASRRAGSVSDGLIPSLTLPARPEATGAKTLLAAALLLVALMLSPAMRLLQGKPPRPLERSLSPATPWRLAYQLTSAPGAKPFYPQLADALQLGYPQGRFQGRIFASETLGDYLEWALPPDYPVLIFNHPHLFPPEHWRDCLNVLAAEPGWRDFLDRSGVNLVVIEVEPHPLLTEALKGDSDWRVVVDETDLLQKRDPRTRLLIAVRKVPVVSRDAQRSASPSRSAARRG